MNQYYLFYVSSFNNPTMLRKYDNWGMDVHVTSSMSKGTSKEV